MEPSSSEELPLYALQLMQRKKDEEDAENEQRMREQSESALVSVEEHKENLRKTVQRMGECKEDFKEYLKIKDADHQGAIRRLKHDKQFIAQRQENLQDLDEEIRELTEERDHLEKRVLKYAVYSHYMDKFVQATNMEVQRVMSRFKTLVLAREHLRKMTHQGQEKICDARANLDIVTKDGNESQLHIDNMTAQYQRQLDKARQNCVHWERTWNHIQNTAAEQTITFGKIRMACLNLYRHVCEWSRYCRETPVLPEDTEGQLQIVRRPTVV